MIDLPEWAKIVIQLLRFLRFNTARRLSKGRLEVTTIDDIFDKFFKTKCLRMFASGKDTVITLEQLPSGRYRVPAYRVNCRKYCFRSLCVKLLNRIAWFIYYKSSQCFIIIFKTLFLFTEHKRNIDFIMRIDTNIYIHTYTAANITVNIIIYLAV